MEAETVKIEIHELFVIATKADVSPVRGYWQGGWQFGSNIAHATTFVSRSSAEHEIATWPLTMRALYEVVAFREHAEAA